jgi:hypothetical protein
MSDTHQRWVSRGAGDGRTAPPCGRGLAAGGGVSGVDPEAVTNSVVHAFRDGCMAFAVGEGRMSTPLPEPDRLVDLDLSAVPESEALARQAVGGIAVDHDAVAAVVSEAVANTVAHAYPAGAADGRVGVPLIRDFSDRPKSPAGPGRACWHASTSSARPGPMGSGYPPEGGSGRAERRLARFRRRAK